MKQKRKIKAVIWPVVIAGLFFLILSSVPGWTAELPIHVASVVEKEYPGARILDVRHEKWKGQMVWEVEIETQGGKEWELIISEDGELLEVLDEEDGLPWFGGELSIGAGVMAETEIYKGADSEIEPVFLFRYENGPFEIQAYDSLDVSWAFYEIGSFKTAVKGAVFFNEGYDPGDSTYLSGMDELDTLYSAGLVAEYQIGAWTLGFEALQDVSGEHDGQELELSLSPTWVIGEFEFTPTLAASWQSCDTVDYFYGVSTREARADRPAYSPSSSYELELEVMVTWHLFSQVDLVGIAGVTTYGSDVKDSPIVDEDYSAELVFGVVYTF